MRKDFEISSASENLRIVEKVIDDMSLELDLTDEVYGNVLVATMEATNNAIVHGNKSDPNKQVQLEIFKNEEDLVLTIPMCRTQRHRKIWKKSTEGESF